MKKVLSVLLAMLMLLSLVACGEDNKPASSVNNTPATSTVESKDESSETSSNDIAEEKLFVRGVVENNVYTNEFAGVRFTAPEAMTFYTDEEIAAVYGASEEMFNITLDTSIIYDMYAMNPETGATVNVNYENMGLLYGSLLTAESYLAASKSNLEAVFNNTPGMNVTSLEQSTVNVGGEEMPCINLVIDINGMSLYETLVTKEADNYMMVFTVGALSTEEIDTILAGLENF
ncbi:MAG: hypothetical protein IKU17_09205 [Clostridia bacterium]|nr:hypothetical protein [Clostridia bacterium]